MKRSLLISIAVLFMVAGQGFSWTEFKDGGMHNINYTINSDVWVDYLAPGNQTTVNWLNNGKIFDPYKLQGYNNSRINISGGSVSNLDARDSSRVTMSGGAVGGYLSAFNNSQITMTGGATNYLYTWDSSQVTLSRGSVSGFLNAGGNSQVTMSGGSVNGLGVQNNSWVTMYGGSIATYLYVQGNAQVNWSGGTIKKDLMVYSGVATLTINGSNFAIDGSPVGFGDITSILGGSYSNEPYRRLTGTLANGDIINNQFRIGDSTKIILIPEPATLLLLGLGAGMLRKKR